MIRVARVCCLRKPEFRLLCLPLRLRLRRRRRLRRLRRRLRRRRRRRPLPPPLVGLSYVGPRGKRDDTNKRHTAICCCLT